MFQLKWVWKQMADVRKRYIFALCSTAVLSVMALGNSMITANIMDTVFQPLVDTGYPGGDPSFGGVGGCFDRVYLVSDQLPIPVRHDL